MSDIPWEPVAKSMGGIAVSIAPEVRENWARELVLQNILLERGECNFIASGDSIVVIIESGEVMDCVIRRRWRSKPL